MRPRAVRDFRGWTEPWDDVAGQEGQPAREGGGPYFMAIVKAVDRVHDTPVLRQWWRKGDLVPNRAHPHPYQADIPAEYQQADRWFRLDTALDPPPPWKLTTNLQIFSLALVRGKSPTRQWLVYAHAPLADRKAGERHNPRIQTDCHRYSGGRGILSGHGDNGNRGTLVDTAGQLGVVVNRHLAITKGTDPMNHSEKPMKTRFNPRIWSLSGLLVFGRAVCLLLRLASGRLPPGAAERFERLLSL